MGKYKIRHIGWFFGFIWNCIRDLRYGMDCFNEIGLWKENWQDLGTRIYFDTDPEALETTRQLNEFFENERIEKRYADKPINPALYGNITISNLNSNDMDKLEPRLTEEEFGAGKQGYAWLDHKTGKIVFKDETGDKK